MVFGHDGEVREWISAELGYRVAADYAIGIVQGDLLIAGIGYGGWKVRPDGSHYACEMSIASTTPSWCSRRHLQILFGIPFLQWEIERIQASLSRANKSARKFVDRVGFKYEGTGRKGWPDGGDVVVYSMLQSDCRWLKGVTHEPERRQFDAGTRAA